MCAKDGFSILFITSMAFVYFEVLLDMSIVYLTVCNQYK